MKPWIFVMSLMISSPALASVDLYTGFNIGALTMEEDGVAASFHHAETFFIGHLGAGLGAKFKLDVGNWGLGVVTDAAWIGNTVERTQQSTASSATYRNEYYRLIGGLVANYKMGGLSLCAEYYPFVENTVSFSDEKDENPFRRNDKLKGTGGGLGLSVDLGGIGLYQLMFRRLSYANIQTSGAALFLPTSVYSAPIYTEVFTGWAWSL